MIKLTHGSHYYTIVKSFSTEL